MQNLGGDDGLTGWVGHMGLDARGAAGDSASRGAGGGEARGGAEELHRASSRAELRSWTTP